jgi:FMN-dependent NADH-azoreductase
VEGGECKVERILSPLHFTHYTSNMKKTLVVTFTPRTDSHTKKLVDVFVEEVKGKTELEFLDLTKVTPDLMQGESLNGYVKRNLAKVPYTESEGKAMELMDKLTAQVEAADYLVLGFPMYNYFLPGLVKVWIDNITQQGKAFTNTEFGPKGLWTEKKGLVINTSGSTPLGSARDYSTPYIKFMFDYWGFKKLEVHGLYAIKFSGILPEKLEGFRNEMKRIVVEWY